MPRKRQDKKKTLTGYDRMCNVQTMALSFNFVALRHTLQMEAEQLAQTGRFLKLMLQTKKLDLFQQPMVYNSN